MDPKNLVVGLGLGALGAAAVAYYGFAHANDQGEIDNEANNDIQEKSKRPDMVQPGGGVMENINKVIGKSVFKVGTSRSNSEGNNSKTNNNNNDDDKSNQVDAAAVKNEVTGALGNWSNFWKEQYKVQRVNQDNAEN